MHNIFQHAVVIGAHIYVFIAIYLSEQISTGANSMAYRLTGFMLMLSTFLTVRIFTVISHHTRSRSH